MSEFQRCFHCGSELSQATGEAYCPNESCSFVRVIVNQAASSMSTMREELEALLAKSHDRPGGRESFLLDSELVTFLTPRLESREAQLRAEEFGRGKFQELCTFSADVKHRGMEHFSEVLHEHLSRLRGEGRT